MDYSARRKIFVELKLGHGLNLLDFTTKGSGWFVLKIFCSSILVTGRTSRWEGWWPWERSFLGTSWNHTLVDMSRGATQKATALPANPTIFTVSLCTVSA